MASEVLAQLSQFNATYIGETPGATTAAPGASTSDVQVSTWFGGTTKVYEWYGGGDSTPAQWSVASQTPSSSGEVDAEEESSMASSYALRRGVIGSVASSLALWLFVVISGAAT